MSTNHRWGQWAGEFVGQPSGIATLSCDRNRPGEAYVTTAQPDGIPAGRFDLKVVWTDREFSAETTRIRIHDPQFKGLIDASTNTNPNISWPTTVSARGVLRGDVIEGSWMSAHPNGEKYESTFVVRNSANDPARRADRVLYWDEFKDLESNQPAKRQGRIFRGQGNAHWRLRTSFHRHGRYDIERYAAECVPWLAARPELAGKFDLKNPREFGALLNFAQHHGLPTPLLDWSKSPFVAAYFAFTAPPPEATEGMVRVFELDASVWGRNTYQAQLISDPFPSLSVKTFDPVANPRCAPQESVHLFCNVDDVEALITRETPRIKKSLGTTVPLLSTYDLPLSERKKALRDLAGMGITADKLFPGDYGVCRAAKERWLYIS